MPSGPAIVGDSAASELRGAAHVIARYFPEGHPRRFILSALGEHLEGGDDVCPACALCGRPFSFNAQFFKDRNLSEPRRCFCCRVLVRGR